MPSLRDREGGWGRGAEGVVRRECGTRASGYKYPCSPHKHRSAGDSAKVRRVRWHKVAGREETSTEVGGPNKGDNYH